MSKVILDCGEYCEGGAVVENKPEVTFLEQILCHSQFFFHLKLLLRSLT